MGSIIRSTASAILTSGTGLVGSAARVSLQSIRSAGLYTGDIGIMINAGVYNEGDLREPSISSLIQDRIENADGLLKKSKTSGKGMFSFDLHNGGGGTISAIQVLDGFIHSGKTTNGIVVAGDTVPVFSTPSNFDYVPATAAIVLSKGDKENGFLCFKTDTYEQYIEDFKSTITWNTGKYKFEIFQKETYLENCVLCAKQSIFSFLEQNEISADDIDLVVCSLSPVTFPDQIDRIPGFESKVFIKRNDHVYSAGLLLTLGTVFETERFRQAENVLFVSVGAGITVSLALYRNP